VCVCNTGYVTTKFSSIMCATACSTNFIADVNGICQCNSTATMYPGSLPNSTTCNCNRNSTFTKSSGVCVCKSGYFSVQSSPLACVETCPENASPINGICYCRGSSYILSMLPLVCVAACPSDTTSASGTAISSVA